METKVRIFSANQETPNLEPCTQAFVGTLTTNHSQSSYGQPVFIYEGYECDHKYSPCTKLDETGERVLKSKSELTVMSLIEIQKLAIGIQIIEGDDSEISELGIPFIMPKDEKVIGSELYEKYYNEHILNLS